MTNQQADFFGGASSVQEEDMAGGIFQIFILSSDENVLAGLIRSTKYSQCTIQSYCRMEDLFEKGHPQLPSCLLLSHKLPDEVNPIDVIKRLKKEKWNLPVLYFAREWNRRLIVEIMRTGADDFLTIPVDSNELCNSVTSALKKASKYHSMSMYASKARASVASLNGREKQIVKLITRGLINKEIADELKLALITVKVYRAQAMKKLGAGNPAELVKVSVLGGLEIGNLEKSSSFGEMLECLDPDSDAEKKF